MLNHSTCSTDTMKLNTMVGSSVTKPFPLTGFLARGVARYATGFKTKSAKGRVNLVVMAKIHLGQWRILGCIAMYVASAMMTRHC